MKLGAQQFPEGFHQRANLDLVRLQKNQHTNNFTLVALGAYLAGVAWLQVGIDLPRSTAPFTQGAVYPPPYNGLPCAVGLHCSVHILTGSNTTAVRYATLALRNQFVNRAPLHPLNFHTRTSILLQTPGRPYAGVFSALWHHAGPSFGNYNSYIPTGVRARGEIAIFWASSEFMANKSR
ncbi:hypothetical protein BS17DRAFT_380557 [Gyrodon lividus]|nr:hypothetical protein BS17DRAFT_380557 [Gyrodon lividus]